MATGRVEVTAYCSACNSELEVEERRDVDDLRISPCDQCISESKADGHREGHDEGYEEADKEFNTGE